MKKSKTQFPEGWDEARVQRVIGHYENQSDEEAVAEDERAWADKHKSSVQVPNEVLPDVLEVIERYRRTHTRA